MINRLRVLTALMPVVVVLAASQWCFASSITLVSSGGGVYDYGILLDPNEMVFFGHNDEITLSGLSGVTGASVPDGLGMTFTVSSFTPSSVVFAQTGMPAGIGFTAGSIPATIQPLVIDSSVLTLGTVDFTMQTANEGTVTGTVQGPVVSAVPEPSSLVLLGTAMLGLVGLARRRLH